MSENQLINKRYYEQFINDNELAHPIRVLGEHYMIEQKNEIPDLANIRFAQGEVYFHHKDFETSIFKWENIHNELEPWAKKNMADAFFLLELYKNAEETYKSISTDSILLNTEVGLQLFSLYSVQGNIESAFKVIKKVVALNPDYLNVTKMARDFFESQQDWNSAAELAASEAIRTESFYWFDILKGYVENDYTKDLDPLFFENVLKSLVQFDQNSFVDMISLLSNHYQNNISWIVMMNELFAKIEAGSLTSSPKIALYFKDTYTNLLNGQFLVNQLNGVIPKLLTNWIKINRSQLAASAILAWNEFFPASIPASIVDDAERCFYNEENQQVSLKEITQLLDSILNWASGIDVETDYQLDLIEIQISQLPTENAQSEKLISTIRNAIMKLTEKRIEVENKLITSIERSEEILTKLKGATHQLEDLEDEKTKVIRKFYLECKEAIESNLFSRIPKLLQGCSELITEESDFGKINHELNDEMNKRIHEHIQNNVLPNFYESLKYWIEFSKEELEKSQEWLNERSEGFNFLFGKERMVLDGDFKVLEDWQRDIDRMTSGISVDKVNIMLKFTPAQLLLRSAGKLFGSFSQNNTILYNKYKSFVENDHYEEVTDEIVRMLMLQFDLFEKALERDIKIFFKKSFQILSGTASETKQLKHTYEESLKKIKENPELFSEPLKLFELRLRQYEWMMMGEKSLTRK